MHEPEAHLRPAEIERKLLVALCSPVIDRRLRKNIFDRLATHDFATVDHETIFRALYQIPLASAERVRETLSARVTRLGFPDIDVESILANEPPSSDEVRVLLQRLEG